MISFFPIWPSHTKAELGASLLSQPPGVHIFCHCHMYIAMTCLLILAWWGNTSALESESLASSPWLCHLPTVSYLRKILYLLDDQFFYYKIGLIVNIWGFNPNFSNGPAWSDTRSVLHHLVPPSLELTVLSHNDLLWPPRNPHTAELSCLKALTHDVSARSSFTPVSSSQPLTHNSVAQLRGSASMSPPERPSH